jgi:hypothetical protein
MFQIYAKNFDFEFGVLKGQSPLKIMGGQRGEGALYFKYKRGVLLAF